MQESLILRDDTVGASALNRKLKDGWKVVKTCAMPSSASIATGTNGTYGKYETSFPPTCLVIIEKE